MSIDMAHILSGMMETVISPGDVITAGLFALAAGKLMKRGILHITGRTERKAEAHRARLREMRSIAYQQQSEQLGGAIGSLLIGYN